MSDALDQAAHNYRIKQLALKQATLSFDAAKANFIQEYEHEFGSVGTGSFPASDGYSYGRVAKKGTAKLDFDRLCEDHLEIALNVSKIVLDEEALMEYVEAHEEVRPIIAQYMVPGNTTLALMPVRETKDEEYE